MTCVRRGGTNMLLHLPGAARHSGLECLHPDTEPRRWPTTRQLSAGQKCSIFPVGRLGGKLHQRHLRERRRGCGTMGKMGLGQMGNGSQIVSFFSDFPPISNEFHTFFLHFPLGTFGIFPQFPPFSPNSPHFFIFPIFLYPCSSGLIQLRLTPTPVTPPQPQPQPQPEPQSQSQSVSSVRFRVTPSWPQHRPQPRPYPRAQSI